MQKMIVSILLSLFIGFTGAKSPHGAKFEIDCATCHTTDNWKIIRKKGFNHDKTKFPLRGQHTNLDCKRCHADLVFSNTKTDCKSCHTDVHQGTTGADCARCHTTSTWIVTRVKKIHQEAGFPLRGMHEAADCNRCHTSASALRFDNVRTDCYACHKTDYLATKGKTYDHFELGFDNDCARCHNMSGLTWNSIGKGFDHSYFPLTGGHNLDCKECHEDGNYKVKLRSECTSCHGGKRSIAASNLPAHNGVFARFSCGECHTTKTWNSVKFKQHDGFYGIYSGNHKGAWTKCTDCHVNDSGWDSKNTCNRCHSNITHL